MSISVFLYKNVQYYNRSRAVQKVLSLEIPL